jgi:hypothetical protein
VARVASTLLVLALLGGTAVAFAITESLKLQRTPVLGTRVDKIFSPVCDCPDPVANISFRVRERDTVEVSVVDGDGDVVRRLGEEDAADGERVEFVWDGLGDEGRLIPEGTYRARVHLARARFTTELPNDIVLDSTKPTVQLTRVVPQTFSPDGDGRRDRVRVFYTSSEPARGFLYVNGRKRGEKRFRREEDRIEWYGKVAGKSVPAGAYRLSVDVVDAAGNRSARTGEYVAHVRYIALARAVVVVRPAQRFAISVRTDAASYRWRFARGRGTSSSGTLKLRAPAKPGFYTLFVDANGHADRATVAVRKVRR